VALALASAVREAPIAPAICAIGEVSLAGDIRRVPGLDRRLAEAARLGFTTALVPGSTAGDTIGPAAGGIRSVPVRTLREAIDEALALSGQAELASRRLRPVRAT
jgi:DNA repair protein RadA/Sms